MLIVRLLFGFLKQDQPQPVYRPHSMRADVMTFKEQVAQKKIRDDTQRNVPLLVNSENKSLLSEIYYGLTRHKLGGVVLIEGDAGAGKTLVCEHLGQRYV